VARIELSAPEYPVHAWGASEWAVRIDNNSNVELPFNDHVLDRGGVGGATVVFEIASKDGNPSTFSSREFASVDAPHPGRNDVIKPGDHKELMAVLHGEMDWDRDARARGEAVDFRFKAAFDTPGVFIVTAILRLNNISIRSNSVKIEVAGPPVGSERALEDMKALSRTGICIHVQGMLSNDAPNQLNEIAQFIQREKGTFYGAQLQVGVAMALRELSKSQVPSKYPGSIPSSLMPTIEGVKLLIAEPGLPQVGLEHSLEHLRQDIAAAEKKSK
jgi:hypothetical protein